MRSFAFGILAACFSSVCNAELVIVEPGSKPAPIVLCQGAPPRTRDAALTLAEYIEKITGAKPDLIEGTPATIPDHAIWVGYQPAIKALFPNVDLTFTDAEDTLIAANENHLIIAGRDRWDPRHMEAEGRLAKKTGMQQEYGTANAVYTFMQEDLGVRWLWPNEEDLIKRDRIVFKPFVRHYHPQIRARSGMFVRLQLGDNKEGPDELWARFQRVQLDSLEVSGGHAFNQWWDRYHETHPDYFALQPDGTRSPNATPSNTKLCESNPAVWDQWLAGVGEQLTEDPTRRVFNASENDGYDFGHCVCEQCLAKDRPEAEKFTQRWRGKKEDRPALSDRQVIFANTLAKMLKEKYPDKDYFVQLHAYGYSRPAPLAVTPAENVLISSVANFHLRGDGVGDGRTKAMKEFADWSEKTTHLVWRPNLGNPVGSQWAMPDVCFRQTAEDFRFVADHHCVGLFFDMLWFHWATQGPYYYLLAHLAWNPHADAEAVMDDYYERAFGPAAEDMKAYWQLLEDTRMSMVAEIPNRMRAFDIPQKYTPGMLARARALMDSAAAKSMSVDPKYARRVAFMKCGLDYTELLVNTRAAMQRYEASKLKDARAKAEVLDCWQRAEAMKKAFPEYAINWQAVYRVGGKDKRVMGLHPDTPLSGRTKREKEARGLE